MWDSIIELSYTAAIIIASVACTIEWLATKGKHEDSKAMLPFIRLLLGMNVLGYFLHPAIRIEGNLFSADESRMAISISCGILTALFVFWIKGMAGAGEKSGKIYDFARKYMIFYLTALTMGMGIVMDYRWGRFAIDIPIIMLFLIGCPTCIREGIKNGDSRESTVYRISVTVLLAIIYTSYLIGQIESTSKWAMSLVSFTVFCWIIIDGYTAIIFYKKGFSSSYRIVKPGPQMWTLDRALEQVGETYNLTDREKEILGEIYNGKTNPQIGDALFISRSTVKAHIYNLFKKMGVKSRVEAVRLIKNQEEKDL